MSDPRNRGDQQSSNRVRKDGADYDRTTGNLIYAWFIHREARPVDGISDCQWHVHCIVVNATFDEQEKQWKAIQMGNVKTDAPFYQAAYTSLLAEKLMASGYAIRRSGDDFELANVSRELIDKFSRRHAKSKMAQSILANLPKVRPIPQWNRTKSGETVGRER